MEPLNPNRSRSPHKRKSLASFFDHLDINAPRPSADAAMSTPPKRTRLLEDFGNSIRQKFPIMKSIPMEEMTLTIRADSAYRTYARDQDPGALFKKATQYLGSLRSIQTEQQQSVIEEGVHEAIIHAIFGSNRIEKAGLGFDITLHLCQKVLRGEPVPDIDEREPEYQSKLLDLISRDKSLQDQPAQYILRGRREIIQHVRAFQYLIDRFVVRKEDMTEDLIKKTHAILCKDVSVVDPKGEWPEVPSEQYAGRYRNVPVGAGSTMFVVPKFIPEKLQEMFKNLKKEMEEGETSGSIDPFSLAAKYSLRFVEIHPFLDGNGRTCRMILNAILFRYVGIVIPIGEREEDRVEYMDIKKRASAQMEGHGEYATFVLTKSTRAIRKLKQKLHGKKKT